MSFWAKHSQFSFSSKLVPMLKDNSYNMEMLSRMSSGLGVGDVVATKLIISGASGYMNEAIATDLLSISRELSPSDAISPLNRAPIMGAEPNWLNPC